MFQNFNAGALAVQRSQSPTQMPIDEARELIGRYPDLGEAELARLINLYRAMSALDMALMLSDREVAPNLDRFSSEHRSRIRPPFRHYAALLIYAAVGLALVGWAVTRATGA